MSRSPDFHLKALNTRTDQRTGKIGAAWLNADGSIAIKLDMFVTLASDPDLLITLFVNDRPVETDKTKHVDPFGPEGERPSERKKRKSGIVNAPVSVRHRIKDE